MPSDPRAYVRISSRPGAADELDERVRSLEAERLRPTPPPPRPNPHIDYQALTELTRELGSEDTGESSSET